MNYYYILKNEQVCKAEFIKHAYVLKRQAQYFTNLNFLCANYLIQGILCTGVVFTASWILLLLELRI